LQLPEMNGYDTIYCTMHEWYRNNVKNPIWWADNSETSNFNIACHRLKLNNRRWNIEI
jgi:hypothetical protein